MAIHRIHTSIPKDLAAELEKHPGLNKSKVTADALRKTIANSKTCPCWSCTSQRPKVAA